MRARSAGNATCALPGGGRHAVETQRGNQAREALALWKDGFDVMADRVQRMRLLESRQAAGRGAVEQCSE